MAEANLLALAELISRSIVSEPEAVRVVVDEEDGDEVVLEVTVASADVGRLIGRKGRTIDALRTVIDCAASRDGRRASVEVAEPDAD